MKSTVRLCFLSFFFLFVENYIFIENKASKPQRAAACGSIVSTKVCFVIQKQHSVLSQTESSVTYCIVSEQEFCLDT